MPILNPRFTKEEFARLGDEIFAKRVSPRLVKDDEGKFVVIDIETGEFEIDVDELAASDHLLVRLPNAQVWVTQIGTHYARRFGTHRQSAR